MVLIWWLGDVFSEPLLDVVGFVGRYRWLFTTVTVLLVAGSVWRARRRGRSEIETVDEVADELAELEDAPTTPSGTSRPVRPE
jgi:hypothetical protein